MLTTHGPPTRTPVLVMGRHAVPIQWHQQPRTQSHVPRHGATCPAYHAQRPGKRGLGLPDANKMSPSINHRRALASSGLATPEIYTLCARVCTTSLYTSTVSPHAPSHRSCFAAKRHGEKPLTKKLARRDGPRLEKRNRRDPAEPLV